MPEIDGILFREATHLIACDAQEGDTDMFGNPIPPGKKTFARRKTGELIEQVPSPNNDFRAYGQWRHQKRRDDGRWIDGELYQEYYTCPVYEAQGTKVLQGTIYSPTDPRVEAVMNVDHGSRDKEEKLEEAA